jgi:cytochrome c peroxidase
VPYETFTGDGPISYWNNYVGVTQMGGHGNFHDPRPPLELTIIQPPPDRVTPQLAALLRYQLSLQAPAPPRGSFDRFAARRGELLFKTIARCAECHTGRSFTDVGDGPIPILHAPGETGMETEYASRSVTKLYRTSPLRGIWQHPPYFHDGSAADLLAVVNHYNQPTVLNLGLTEEQKADLVEYLKSL